MHLYFICSRIRRTSEEPTMNELMAAMVLSSLSCSPVFHNQPKGTAFALWFHSQYCTKSNPACCYGCLFLCVQPISNQKVFLPTYVFQNLIRVCCCSVLFSLKKGQKVRSLIFDNF